MVRIGDMLHHTEPHGEAPRSFRGQSRGHSVHCGSHRKRWAGQGRQLRASLGLNCMNNFGGLGAIEVVSSCVVPGIGVI